MDRCQRCSNYVEWFADFWGCEVYETYRGFIAYEIEPEKLFITHFFIAKEYRETIREFHDFFKEFKEIARKLGKKKIETSNDKSTDRARALVYIEQKVAKFVLTRETDEEYFLEYIL